MVKKVEFNLLKKKNQRKKLVKGIGIGAVVGSTMGTLTGMLFSQKSGKETREKIKTSTINATKNLKNSALKAKDNALKLVKSTGDKIKSKRQLVKEENAQDKD